MNHLAPAGPVYQAGTLSGNPLAMAAGYNMVKHLHSNHDLYVTLEKTTARLEDGLRDALANSGHPFVINRVGSMISVHFTATPVVDFDTAKTGDNDTFKRFFHHMLDNGNYLPPSAYETWFVCSEIGEEEIERTLEAVRKFR